jgi:phosphoketolase
VAVVDSVAALLVEAKRSMIEARFLLLSPSPPPVWLRMEQAIAVLEAGVGVIDAAIEEDEPDDDGSQA